MNKKYNRILLLTLLVIISLSISPHENLFASAAEGGNSYDQYGPRISYHTQTGKVRFLAPREGSEIQQPFALPQDVTPEFAARSFLTEYGEMFGLSNQANELSVMKETFTSNGRSGVRFQQVHQGISVLGGELIVQMDAAKNVLSVSGEILPEINLVSTPSVEYETAQQVALETIAKIYEVGVESLSATEPELWIYNPLLIQPGGGFTSLVWRMDVFPNEAGTFQELVLVDAIRGSVVLNFNQIDTAMNRLTHTANNTTTQPGTLVCDESNPTCSGGDSHAVNAHIYAGDTYDFYLSYHGRDSLDNAGMNLISTVHYDVDYCNAFWNGSQMTYGDGCFLVVDDVVAHEMTHGVTEHESNLFYYYQSGAINESFSDIFGEFVDLTNGKGDDSPGVRWLLGEEASTGALRDMRDPPAAGDPDRITHANYWTTTGDNGGVHSNSGVGNKAAYLLVDGDTFNGYTITGLGITKVATIFYEVQTNLLTSGSDYADLYDVLYQGCLNVVGTAGITTSDCQEVQDAVNATEMNLEPFSGYNLDAPICAPGQTPTNVLFDDMESGSGNWTFGALVGTTRWQYDSPYGDFAHSGSHFLYADDWPAEATDSFAAMNASVPIPSNSYLHFAHAYHFEGSNYDGGVLEYSIDGGSTWNDAGALFDYNGYDGAINTCCGNPLGGRDGFLDVSHGYTSSRLDLSALTGQNARFRWRMGLDSSVFAWGWWLDDVRIYTCGAAAEPDIHVSPPSFDVTLPVDGTTERQMTIENTGAGPLSFNISEANTTTFLEVLQGGTKTQAPGGRYFLDGELHSGQKPERFVHDAVYIAPTAISVLNFDDLPQPCSFADTTALRETYAAMGVHFSGPAALDGGGILDECGGFSVSGHSPPNFLAFNGGSTFSDGGIPRNPETVAFDMSVSHVEAKVGSNTGSGNTLTMTAYDGGGAVITTANINLDPTLQVISISTPGIRSVVFSSPASVFVLDDFGWNVESGDLTTYNDRGTFDSVCPGLPVEDFENTLVADTSIIACPGPFNNATNNACFAPGGILDGISLMNADPANNMVVIGDGALGAHDALVGPNTFVDHQDILFPNGDVYAVGFDLVNPSGTPGFEIYVYGPGNILLGSTSSLSGMPGVFWGVQTNQSITRIRTESAASEGELFDNIAFGPCGADVPWLTETPTAGTVPAGASQNITVGFDATGLIPGTYTADIVIANNDPDENPTIIPVTMNVGGCPDGPNADYFTTQDNENNAHTGNGDCDMDVYLFNDDPLVPIEFNIFIPDPAGVNELMINAYDVDETNGEVDEVYFNGHFAGTLTGANDTWSTTVLGLDPAWITPADNLVTIYVDVDNPPPGSNWAVNVDWGQVNKVVPWAHIRPPVDIGTPPYLAGTTMVVDVEVDTDLAAQDLRTEINLRDPSGVILDGQVIFHNVIGTNNDPIQASVTIPISEIGPNYDIQVLVFDAPTSRFQDSHVIPFTISPPSQTELWVDPLVKVIHLGGTDTVDITLTDVNDLYGISLEMHFDPIYVEVVDDDPGTPGVQITPGTCPSPDNALQNTADNTAGTINFDVASLAPSPPCNGSGIIASITFGGKLIGSSPLHFANWLLSDSNGNAIPVISVHDGTLNVEPPPTGVIDDHIDMQGRADDSGAEVCAWDGPTLEGCTTTAPDGYYELVLDAGTYDITVEMERYLDSEKLGVSITAGSTTTLNTVTLPGGDTNDDDIVNIQDLAFMGARYLCEVGDPCYDARANINNDGIINIQDLAMTGGNYQKTSPVPWP